MKESGIKTKKGQAHRMVHIQDEIIPTPKEIVEYLNERVIGQEKAKKRLAVAVYNHYKRINTGKTTQEDSDPFKDVTIEKSNIMLLGGTGTGKTFLIENIAKMLGVPFYIQDCTKLTESGYVGEDVENCITGLLCNCDFDVEKTQRGIVCLDEVDKLTATGPCMSITRDVGGVGVQQGLLKIVEGSVVGVMPNGGRKHPDQQLTYVDTTNILFIAMGAFPGLTDKMKASRNKTTLGFGSRFSQANEDSDDSLLDKVQPADLEKFGMIPEFIGRFPVLAHTNQLTESDLVRIISEPRNSLLRQYQKLMHIDGKELNIDKKAIELIAHAALVSGTGARGLRGIKETVLNDFMYDSADSRVKKFVITKKYCEQALSEVLQAC